MTADTRVEHSLQIIAPRDPSAAVAVSEAFKGLYLELSTQDGESTPEQFARAGDPKAYRLEILGQVVLTGKADKDFTRNRLTIYPTFHNEAYESAWAEIEGFIAQSTPSARPNRWRDFTGRISSSISRLLDRA